ncbi:ABC transporter ATP-binding protein [Miltoncostaea marina]|uniref:ABC transporter ATP-binding protein n=1 Tax=Miltoncostaea marina TaxID=2843215 RepID=UPI001C3D19BD|nr:ABC transporter ATP-binding protein [Miltoncostaea marina]
MTADAALAPGADGAPAAHPATGAAAPPALEVVGLEKTYDDGTAALRGLDLRVPAGAFYGLLGPNGSGKSTLIGMITGLVRAPAGRIAVFGRDAVADARRARLRVGLAPQEVHLDRFLTVRQVLSYHGRYFGMAAAEADARADELLAAFDLASKAGARPNRLSGGMRRRLLIARALMHRPSLAILDEPTAGVDLELRHELWRYLRRLQRDEGTTVLLTTHYLEEAEALCERIAFIRAGRIIAEGTADELRERFGGSRLEDAYVAAMR